jgi:pyrimidine operon attenuation protein/uracil phosphoribosyltransferase
MVPRIIIGEKQLSLIIRRLVFELIENHPDPQKTVIIGLQPRGINLVGRIKKELDAIQPGHAYQFGSLDVTFYRDDFRRREKPLLPSATNIDFIIEQKEVVLVDDVFYTGRTVRSGLDALLAFGRPKKVELMVLIERRFNAELPISPTYVGASVDTISQEHVTVKWRDIDGEDQVILLGSEDGSEG